MVKRNWRVIIEELKAKGYNAYKISLAIGARLPSVQLWENGSEPKHSAGEALLDLHRQVCSTGNDKKA